MIPEGAYATSSGLNQKVQFGLNYRLCYADREGEQLYDTSKLVFPKFGQKVSGQGVVNHVPCYRKTYFPSRKVFKFEPAPFKPILLNHRQRLVTDAEQKSVHQHSQNSIHHAGSFIGTWDMQLMQFKGGAVGSSQERMRFANHDSYTASGKFNPSGHLQMNGAARVGVGAIVQDGLRHQDNIVSRGEKVSGHLHQIYGNAGANYLMTPLQIQNSGVSAASGGVVNRTLYWQPALIRMGTGEPVMTGKMKVYYKMAGNFATMTEWYPDGLVMIAGFPPGSTAALNTEVASWRCSSAIGVDAGDKSYIPRCKYSETIKPELIQTIKFPNCWDGVNLDSEDHMSHMAYAEAYITPAGRGSSQCPVSHPVKLPKITQNIHIPITKGDDTGTWTLSSDNYTLRDRERGKTSHADWVHGWKREVALEWLNFCQNRPIDCGGNYIGLTPPIMIDSITYSGNVATVTTPKPHGLRTGLNVLIQGAKQAEYNGNTNIELAVSNMICNGAGLVDVKHEALNGSEWRGFSTYGTPFRVVGANEPEFNGLKRSYGYSGKEQFSYKLDSGRCPASEATGTIKLLVDNGVPKQTVTVLDDYTFTYQLQKEPMEGASGRLTFRVGRELY